MQTEILSPLAMIADAALPIVLAASDESLIGGVLGQLSAFIKVAIGIGLVIFVHELGHFAAAKLFGVKCEKFYIGFDVPLPKIGPITLPSTLGKFRYGETEYGIGILPLGGYVKMLGQDDDPRELARAAKAAEQRQRGLAGDPADTDSSPDGRGGVGPEGRRGDTLAEKISDGPLPSAHTDEPITDATPLDPRSYQAQPVWQRMIIISAGVVMNVITGVLFAALAYGFGVPQIPAAVGEVVPGGPAWVAGMEPGGRVVAVGRKSDPQMSFRKMQQEILTNGLRDSDEPVPVTVDYGETSKQFELRLMTHPAAEDLKMIGIATPHGPRLDRGSPALPGTVADDVLTDQDAGSRIAAFDGNVLPPDGPTTALDNYIHSHPTEPIDLQLEPVDGVGSDRTVTLPPQTAHGIGIGLTTGPITAIANGSAAAKAGLQSGDVIVAVDGVKVGDPFDLAVQLASLDTPVQLSVRRPAVGEQTGGDQTGGDNGNDNNDGDLIDVSLTPRPGLQTNSPIGQVIGQIAINSLGIAYQPLPIVSSTAIEGLGVGDEIKQVRLTSGVDDLPDYLAEQADVDSPIKTLIDGWTFSPKDSLTILDRTIQALPVGSTLEIVVERQTDASEDPRVLTFDTEVRDEKDSYRFTRGLVRPQRKVLRTADGPGDAIALGLREGQERFNEVLEFLGMAGQGQLKLRHVGGPLSIFQVAKSESEAGISRLLVFLTLLSMNLAILNFLPIPVLDGGHMVFLTYELVTGRRPNEKVQYILQTVGMLFLIALMVIVFTQDIRRLAGY